MPNLINHPSDEPYFHDAAAQFCIIGPYITEQQINVTFPEDFPGKPDLVAFYLRHNGGSRTPQGCIMHCANPAHRVTRQHLDQLYIEGFRSIPIDNDAHARMLPCANMLRHQATMERIYESIPQMKSFLEEHIAIAFDHTGRDLCLSRKSGRIVFMDWEKYKEGPANVAATFRDFVARFWNLHPTPPH